MDQQFLKGKQGLRRDSDRGETNSTKSLIQEQVVKLLKAVRTQIADQNVAIDALTEVIHKKVGKWVCRKGQSVSHQNQKTAILPQLKAAVEQLSKTSQELCQDIFDLNQRCIQREIQKGNDHLQKLKIMHEAECLKLRLKYSQEIKYLHTQIDSYKEQCIVLQQRLMIMQSSKKQNTQKQNRKRQLQKCIETIDQIWQQVQLLKIAQPVHNLYYGTQSLVQSESQRSAYHNDKNYHNVYHQEKQSYGGSTTREHTQPYASQYYPACYNEKGTVLTQRKPGKDVRSTYIRPHREINNLKETNNPYRDLAIQPKYIVPQRKSSRPLSRPKSSQSRYQSSAFRGSQASHIPQTNNHMISSKDMKMIEQRNQRMKVVEERLLGLKKKLQRQFRDSLT